MKTNKTVFGEYNDENYKVLDAAKKVNKIAVIRLLNDCQFNYWPGCSDAWGLFLPCPITMDGLMGANNDQRSSLGVYYFAFLSGSIFN